jgi:hypothetical protein
VKPPVAVADSVWKHGEAAHGAGRHMLYLKPEKGEEEVEQGEKRIKKKKKGKKIEKSGAEATHNGGN